ncbi:hypothetical protein [Pseudoalteromonas sp. 2CM36K]|uniref:hypothetical protein n=1 Tax=Pseudoalteromonas sp. 2CM36K TaxID=2929854 RepID=UPI0020BF6F2B|nr:hypothetical protein [Pseudoalteromonas sp. 2CM36K]MCK8102403.1 hypothetical protein [Pseudoalteromonas sp. 2CM36K]
MNLLSYQLFDHCTVEYDSPSSEPMALTETFEVTVTGVNPSTGLALIDNSCIDVGVNPFGESIDVGVSDALDTSCSAMDITDTCFDDSMLNGNSEFFIRVYIVERYRPVIVITSSRLIRSFGLVGRGE